MWASKDGKERKKNTFWKRQSFPTQHEAQQCCKQGKGVDIIDFGNTLGHEMD